MNKTEKYKEEDDEEEKFNEKYTNKRAKYCHGNDEQGRTRERNIQNKKKIYKKWKKSFKQKDQVSMDALAGRE